ncbi:MAG: cysteine--tRNA ligase, partial [Microvirga sp.]|nr:cysteine--tRNA ligase [Microvirga sp.]
FGGRKWPGAVLRLGMLMTHYREPIDFSLRKLEEANQAWLRWGRIRRQAGDTKLVPDPKPAPAIERLLFDDLNTAGAINSMQALARAAESGDQYAADALIASAAFLGIELRDAVVATQIPEEQEVLIMNAVASRLALIRERNWPEADRIRDELLRQGIQLKDGKDPATGERVTTWEVKR